MGLRDEVSTHQHLRAQLLVLLTVLTGVGAVRLTANMAVTAVWWPAGGVAAITMMVSPRRLWRVLYVELFVAYVVSNLGAGRELLPSISLGASDIAETVLVTQLLIGTVGRTLRRVHDVRDLIFASFPAAVLAACGVGITSATMLGGSFYASALPAATAHTAALVILLPTAMAPRPTMRISLRQLAFQVVGLLLVTLLVFRTHQEMSLAFAPFPLLVWAAASFGVRAVAYEQVTLALFITLLTLQGWGPFASAGGGDRVKSELVQLYLLSMLATALPLALAMRQRGEALDIVRARERSFRDTFVSSAMPMALLNLERGTLRFDEVNGAARSVLRRTPRQLLGVSVDDLLPGDEPVLGHAQAIADGHEPSWYGVRSDAADPDRRIAVNLSLIQKTDGVPRLALHLDDITAQEQLRERLMAERQYIEAVISSTPSLIMVLDRAGKVLLVNPAACAATGYSHDELVGGGVWDVLVPPELRETAELMFQTMDEALPPGGESLVFTRDGRRRQIVYSTQILDEQTGGAARYVVTATDVTDERNTAQLISHLLASPTSVGFVVTDLAGTVTQANRGAELMLGLAAGELAGRAFVDYLDPTQRAERANAVGGNDFGVLVARAAEGEGDPETTEWTLVGANGHRTLVSMTTSPVPDDLGSVVGYLFVAHDVSEAARTQEILVQALDRERDAVARLQALDEARDEFISTVSHELRTPMTSIIGSAELLVEGAAGDLLPAQEDLVAVISRNGDRLLALANDLLSLAQHESHDDATFVTLDLGQVVEESRRSVAPLHRSRDLVVQVMRPVEPVEVQGAPQMLERAITNLLSNAIKFTPDGGTVTVSLEPTGAGEVRLRVSDTGVGIPADEIDNVFERFFRSSIVQDLAIQGTGLGLAIVKQVVERHAGRIEVESEPGRGTTFTLTLPMVDDRAMTA